MASHKPFIIREKCSQRARAKEPSAELVQVGKRSGERLEAVWSHVFGEGAGLPFPTPAIILPEETEERATLYPRSL